MVPEENVLNVKNCKKCKINLLVWKENVKKKIGMGKKKVKSVKHLLVREEEWREGGVRSGRSFPGVTIVKCSGSTDLKVASGLGNHY